MGGVLELHLDKEVWFPGEIVTGLMLLQFKRRTKVREFDAWLYGHEHATVTVRHGKHSTTYRESRPLVELPLVQLETRTALLTPGEFDAGTYTMPFEAPLPHGAPPSFSKGRYSCSASTLYNVHASVGVPWASDPHASVNVPVVMPPLAPTTAPAMASKPASYFTGGTSIELLVDSQDAPRGGWVTGRVRVNTTGTKRLRSIRVALTERAVASARGHQGTAASANLAENLVGEGQAAIGVDFPFQLQVPPTATSSYEGQIVFVRHAVRAEADMAWAMNPTVESPFTVT